MKLIYQENAPVSVNQIAELRHSVGWNSMEVCYNDPRLISYYHIACYHSDKLIGYVDTVSNGVTDAYIQDLVVDPAYQGQGIGTELMNKIITRLKENKII